MVQGSRGQSRVSNGPSFVPSAFADCSWFCFLFNWSILMLPALSGPGDSQRELWFQLYSYTRPITLPELQLKLKLRLCNRIEPKKSCLTSYRCSDCVQEQLHYKHTFIWKSFLYVAGFFPHFLNQTLKYRLNEEVILLSCVRGRLPCLSWPCWAALHAGPHTSPPSSPIP